MNVASSCRKYIIFFQMLLISNGINAMVMDSRYFPWLEQLYTGSDHRHGHITTDAFFITGGNAYCKESRAREENQIVSISGLFGELRLTDVGNALTLAGLNNPIPTDWRWLSDMKAIMPGSMEGQGIDFEGFWPITKHFGIGASALIMQLSSFLVVIPAEDTIKKLYLDAPGNHAQFTSMMSNFYKELQISSTASSEFGAGDTIVYAAFYDVKEYEHKMRKIDLSLWIGGIIPSGVKRNIYNLGSVPFGGNGLWGLFIAPTFELELKEDLKFGMQFRVTKRFSKCLESRLPLDKEQPLFAPTIGIARINPGVSITGTGYVVFEELRAGFGVEGKYTVTYHQEDSFNSNVLINKKAPNFKTLKYTSDFISEYATIRLFYDVAHDKEWKHRPLVSLTWDIPQNHIGGKAFAKTNRILLGCTVNF